MICFEILRIFGEKSQKSKDENRAPTSQSREPTPRHRPTPQHGIPGHDEGLRRGVAIVHSEQISDFCFQTPCIRTPVV